MRDKKEIEKRIRELEKNIVLGKEGKQSKYWETSQEPKPEGFRYPDDTAKYKYDWDTVKKKWVDKNGEEKPVEKVI